MGPETIHDLDKKGGLTVTDIPRLTTLSHGGGCACKVSPDSLRRVLSQLPEITDSNVLVGIATNDDAAVYRVDGNGIVATVDVFTPIVDDPFDFGRIAAANALSDVYAMGGRPLFALSIVGFPTRTLPLEQMAAILRGGADICAQAGIAVVGGHSIDDAEPKYGLAVVGLVAPDRIVRNSTARAGDALMLTKPIGTGMIAQGLKFGQTPAEVLAGAIAGMTTLNRDACEAMNEVGVHAATDVTGFGLLGHLHEMLEASGVSAELHSADVPLYTGTRALAAAGLISGGTRRNADYYGQWTDFSPGVDAVTRMIMADAQTSGGLLMAVAPERSIQLLSALRVRGVGAWTIGRTCDGAAGRIRVD